MRLRLALLLGALLAAAPAAAQELEVGPAGAPVFEHPEGTSGRVTDLPPGTRVRPVSKQYGFYKIRVGDKGRIGWIRIGDTKAPGKAEAAPGTKAGDTAGAAPPPAKAPAKAAPPAKAPPPAKAAPPARVAPPAPGGEATDADGGTAAAPADVPAPPPAADAPLVPPLRLVWPPPLGEWVQTTRTWADSLGPVHLGVAGVLVLAVVLLLLYFVYRIVRFIILLPVRAVRAVARRVGHRVKQARSAPPKLRAEVAERLAEVEGLAAAIRAAGPTGISVHEIYVAAGADDCAVTAFGSAAAAAEARTEFPGWLTLLTADDPVPREDFVRAWMLEVVRARAQSFLDLHPLFGGRGLRAERDQGDQETDILFQFVSADGLGVTLDDGQEKAALFLTTAIERARVHLSNPYAVADYGRTLAGAGDAGEAGREASPVPPLATLLFGLTAHENAGAFAGQAGAVAPEVAAAIAQHRQSGKDVIAGPAVHAALGGTAPGVGMALVAALSGAMSAAAATLKLRQALAAQPGSAVVQASAALGAKVVRWLQGKARSLIDDAVTRALGGDILDAALTRATALRQRLGRDLAQDAQKLLGKWQRVTLTEALLEAHAVDLARVLAAVGDAGERYATMLESLAERPEDNAGLAAVGYLTAGLGAGAFADAPDATRVLIAEAARPLRRTAARPAVRPR